MSGKTANITVKVLVTVTYLVNGLANAIPLNGR